MAILPSIGTWEAGFSPEKDKERKKRMRINVSWMCREDQDHELERESWVMPEIQARPLTWVPWGDSQPLNNQSLRLPRSWVLSLTTPSINFRPGRVPSNVSSRSNRYHTHVGLLCIRLSSLHSEQRVCTWVFNNCLYVTVLCLHWFPWNEGTRVGTSG